MHKRCTLDMTKVHSSLFLTAPVLGLFKSTVNPIFTSIMSRIVGADEQGMYWSMEIDKTYRCQKGKTINTRTVKETQIDEGHADRLNWVRIDRETDGQIEGRRHELPDTGRKTTRLEQARANGFYPLTQSLYASSWFCLSPFVIMWSMDDIVSATVYLTIIFYAK